MADTYRLSAEQVATYSRDGAVLVKGALDARELDLLERGMEEVYADPGERYSKLRSKGGEGETFLSTFPTLRSPSLQKLVGEAKIPHLAAQAMGAQSAQLVLDQIFYKQPGFVNATPWHQDTPFLRVRGDGMARVWLTCDLSPKELTVQMVRGSHRWGVVFSGQPKGSDTTTSGEGKLFAYAESDADAAPPPPDVARYRDSFDILSWDVEPGDALVFNGNMLHGADGAANSPNPRRAFTTMWGAPGLRYVEPGRNAIPTMAQVNKVEVPPGAKIGNWPQAFPVGWSAS